MFSEKNKDEYEKYSDIISDIKNLVSISAVIHSISDTSELVWKHWGQMKVKCQKIFNQIKDLKLENTQIQLLLLGEV